MKRSILIAVALPSLCGCQPAAPSGNEKTEAPVQAQADKTLTESTLVTHSQFTSIDPQKCQLLEENVEEGGWSRRLCEGLAGYRLELTDSDLRQDIIVIPASGRRTELGLTEIVAKGAFNALGKTAEWRGTDPASQDALIVRLGVAADAEGRKPDVSNLIVARLKPTVCIVAVVPPGPGQNERAQTVADEMPPACLKA
jgi:hypothetical protein